eukprot:scaffold180570_cov19-Tisochrysis_lutea.AAC.1
MVRGGVWAAVPGERIRSAICDLQNARHEPVGLIPVLLVPGLLTLVVLDWRGLSLLWVGGDW